MKKLSDKKVKEILRQAAEQIRLMTSPENRDRNEVLQNLAAVVEHMSPTGLSQ